MQNEVTEMLGTVHTVGQKIREIKSINFTKKILDKNQFFAISKMTKKKSIFELEKKFKTSRNAISRKRNCFT